jgi:uncharacterized membrane protein YdbT with pleckstrin-like domain
VIGWLKSVLQQDWLRNCVITITLKIVVLQLQNYAIWVVIAPLFLTNQIAWIVYDFKMKKMYNNCINKVILAGLT